MYAEININKKGSVPLTLTIKYHFKKKLIFFINPNNMYVLNFSQNQDRNNCIKHTLSGMSLPSKLINVSALCITMNK